MNKPRSDSRLFQLTEDDQAQLYDWIATLGFTKAKERLAASPPDGLGVKAHLSSLHAFYIRYGGNHQMETLAEAESIPTAPAPRLLTVAEQAMHSGAFQRSTSPMDTNSFRDVSQWITRQRDQELKRDYFSLEAQKIVLARERLALDREKFRFNAARQALIHFAELALIAKSPDKDNEDKIRAVADLLFQPAPKTVAAPLQPPPHQPPTTNR
jgi:hypothetical protein